MIKHVISSNNFVTVTGSYPRTIYSNGNSMVGSMRYNTQSQNIEVYDGTNWQQMTQDVTVGLSWDADSAIRWVQEKMKEEAEVRELAASNKAVAIALENLNKAKEQLETTIILSRETNDQTTS